MGFPPGVKFNPSDEELLFFLTRKLDGLPIPPMTIQDHHDYFLDPHSLDWSHVENLRDKERYCFVKRVQVSRDGNGKYVRRMSSDGRGFWRVEHSDKKIYGGGGGGRKNGRRVVVGLMTSLNFFDNKSTPELQKDASKTRWIMHEYRLPLQTFQEWVVCRVKDGSKKKNKRKRTERQCSNSISTARALPSPQSVQQQQRPPPPSDRAMMIESAVQLPAAEEEQLLPLSDHSTTINNPKRPVVPTEGGDDLAGLLAGDFENNLLDMLSFDDLDSYVEEQQVGGDNDHPRHKRPRLSSNNGGLFQHPQLEKDSKFWIPRFSKITTC